MDGCPAQDQRQPYFTKRQACYACTFDILDMLLKEQSEEKASAALVDMVWAKVTSSEDELWHYALYDWMLSTLPDGHHRLRELSTPFIEKFLHRRAAEAPDGYELLADYYVRHRLFGLAAKTLLLLADLTTVAMPIEKRIEYLSFALSHARSAYHSGLTLANGSDPRANEWATNGLGAAGEQYFEQLPFLTNDDAWISLLQDKVDVAFVQHKLYKTLSNMREVFRDESVGDEILLTLGEYGLYDVSTLYHRYALPFQLYDMQLLLFDLAQVTEGDKIRDAWQALLHKELMEAGSTTRIWDVVTLKMTSLGQRLSPNGSVFDPRMLFFL